MEIKILTSNLERNTSCQYKKPTEKLIYSTTLLKHTQQIIKHITKNISERLFRKSSSEIFNRSKPICEEAL